MPKLIMTIGLPGSGKTTWAKEEVLKHPVNSYKRVNKDDIRDMLDCGRWSKGAEKIVLQTRDALVEIALMNGHNVIVDDTNLNPVHKETLREIADAFGAEFQVKSFLDIPVEECVQRNEAREFPVPRDVIYDMQRRWLND